MGNSVRTIELRSEQIEKILENENNRKIESQIKLPFIQSEKLLVMMSQKRRSNLKHKSFMTE